MHYKTRMPQFISLARDVQQDIAQAHIVSEQELDWIYANHTNNMPKKIISEYRQMLTREGLSEPYVEITADIVVDGVVIGTKKERGCFRERKDYVDARRAADVARKTEELMNADDVRMLMGHEDEYLGAAIRLCRSHDWEEQAVGLLMASGRRTVELCRTAHMRPLSTPYWVDYSGQAKTRSEVRATAWNPQPVLIPETLACAALKHVQAAVLAENVSDDEFDRVIGRRMRHAVERVLRGLFPQATTLNPRTLRNCFVAIALEAVTPDGTPLRKDHQDPDTFLRHILGHALDEFLPHDAYKKQMLPRLRRHIVLPE